VLDQDSKSIAIDVVERLQIQAALADLVLAEGTVLFSAWPG